MENNTDNGAGRQGGHTPTPWAVGMAIGQENAAIHAVFPKGHGGGLDGTVIKTVGLVFGHSEADRANAAFIVTACNAHAGLVEALRAVEWALSDVAFCPSCNRLQEYGHARACLTAAALAALDGAK